VFFVRDIEFKYSVSLITDVNVHDLKILGAAASSKLKVTSLVPG
jgi:hypothetical protein